MPNCRREGNLHSMVEAWKATPAEKLARLKDIAAEAKVLFAKWTALPEFGRDIGEGKKLAARLDEYYAEAKAIIAEINQENSGEFV